jgi:hypothetical protein
MIPNGTRFIGIAPEVDLTERGSALLNKRTEPYTIDDIRGYKVFTALLTQSGEGESASIFFGDSLVIGRTYNIYSNDGDSADFTNVGAPNNNENTYFIATGTTPNSWGINDGAELSYNTGAPKVNVLENTIGNIWFTYNGVGSYSVNSDGLFTENKTIGFITFNNCCEYGLGDKPFLAVNPSSVNSVYIESVSDGVSTDSVIQSTPIEIRVYN